MKKFKSKWCLIAVLITFLSCSNEEENNSPGKVNENLDLETLQVSEIRPTTALISSFIKSSTEKSLKSRGVCFNSVGNPTINDLKVEDPEGIIGFYTTLLIGLQQENKYYAKLYAITNSGSVQYGNEISFTTTKIVITPTVFTTYLAKNVTANSATLGAVILKNGNLRWDSLKMGISFSSTNKLPGLNDNAIYAKTEVTEPFAISAKNLQSNTLYYYRPFAVSIDYKEIYYGDVQSFTTMNSN